MPSQAKQYENAEEFCVFLSLHVLFFRNNDLFRIRKCLDPVAECMPLLQFVETSCKIDVDQCFIVHGHCTHLVVAGRKELDHIVPVFFVLAFCHVFLTDFFKFINNSLHKCKSVRSHVIMAEIVDIERFRVNLVHRACGVSHSCNFVSIEFFPICGLSFTITEVIGHHFGFQRLRFLKSRCVSIAALLPRPEGIGDSLYRFNLLNHVYRIHLYKK